MEFLRRLAQGGVILLDKVPSNLILGQVAVASGGGDRGIGSGSGSSRSGGGSRGSCLMLVGMFLVQILMGEITVGGHDGCVILKSEGDGGEEGARIRSDARWKRF